MRFLSRPSPIDPMAKPSIFTAALLKMLQNRSVAKILVRCGARTSSLNLGDISVDFRWDSAGFFGLSRGYLGEIARGALDFSELMILMTFDPS